jgi:2-desacetyl-2-hydroxyethyl bacteriochlorophyllide A dehydrogenase
MDRIMKAIRLVEIGHPLQLCEVPVPALGDRDVLLRVRAAGICHSDAHYRAGTSPVGFLPITLGHEIAGLVEEAGSQVSGVRVGDRVCVHYMATCGACPYCIAGSEQFCVQGGMVGKHRDGGYAEYVVVPARSAVPFLDEIPFAHAAIMMCSSATSLHALRKAALKAGERAAIFGAGGLGMSAIQLARAMGALDVYAVDVNAEKLALAEKYGAIPVNARERDPVAEIMRLTGGKGVDVALELIGLPQTMRQAVQSLAVFGRAALVGITGRPFEVDAYRELIGKEAQVIGVSDHLLSELPLLFEYARRGSLDLADVVTRTIPLDAGAVNETLDALQQFGSGVRTVITP